MMKKHIPSKIPKKILPKNAVAAPTQSDIQSLTTLYNERQFEEAAQAARELITRFPKHGFGWKVLGAVLQLQGKIDESLDIKQKAADLLPNDAEAYNNLGNAYQEANRLEEAEKCLRHALKLSPNFVVAHNNLGITLQKMLRLEEAIDSHQKAIALKPDYAEAYYNFGVTLQKLNRLDDAAQAYQQAIHIQASHAKAHSNLGLVCKNLFNYEDSEKNFVKALQLDAQFVDAHYNFALLLLLLGRYPEGWAQYQWFYHPQNKNPSKPNYPKNLPGKEWTGESLAGKIILIHSEQGFGDMIQFVRYAELLNAHGAMVWVLVETPLVEIFKTVPWIDRVLKNGEQRAVYYDYWVFPLALPFWFKTSLESIPMTLPYLSVDQEKSTWWREWLSQQMPRDHKRIGLVWAGSPAHTNDANRSIAFEELKIFENMPNFTFVSLQLGEKSSQLVSEGIGQLSIVNAAPFIHDFTDSAALLQNLDLLITVDSAPAHLAGALNLPVWIMITKMPDWRWLLNRADSAWYKSTRLFRQTERGNWQGVLDDVKQALLEL
jgi:tetratricopeptide (TPR) repeat protein